LKTLSQSFVFFSQAIQAFVSGHVEILPLFLPLETMVMQLIPL